MTAIATPSTPKPLRADAQRNLELLIAAADAEFNLHGADASLEAIAARAGVGIATLYRNFPTRDDLIARVLLEGNNTIVARSAELLTSTKPAEALSIWLRELVNHVTAYRGLISAVAASYVKENGTELCATCDVISNAGAALLERAQASGDIRPDAEVREVILTAHSAAWIAEQTKDPSAVDRLLGILLDGLRVMPPKATALKPRAMRRRRVE